MLPLSLRRLFPRRLFSSMPMGSTSWAPATYPATRRSDHVEIYNSTAKGQVRVPDPFRWLEDASDETDRWTTAQAAYTRTYLDRNPDLPRLEAAFKASNNYAKVWSCAVHISVSYFPVFCPSSGARWSVVLVLQQRP